MSARVACCASLLLAACAHVDSIDDYACPGTGTALAYANFGASFLETWCNGCHSAPPGERQGAPEDVRFDSESDVRRWRERIFARAAWGNDSMPPGLDGPPQTERTKLAEWLACGER